MATLWTNTFAPGACDKGQGSFAMKLDESSSREGSLESEVCFSPSPTHSVPWSYNFHDHVIDYKANLLCDQEWINFLRLKAKQQQWSSCASDYSSPRSPSYNFNKSNNNNNNNNNNVHHDVESEQAQEAWQNFLADHASTTTSSEVISTSSDIGSVPVVLANSEHSSHVYMLEDQVFGYGGTAAQCYQDPYLAAFANSAKDPGCPNKSTNNTVGEGNLNSFERGWHGHHLNFQDPVKNKSKVPSSSTISTESVNKSSVIETDKSKRKSGGPEYHSNTSSKRLHLDHSVTDTPSCYWICTSNQSESNAIQKSNGKGHKLPALNTNLKPRARQGSANDPQSIAARQRRERISERLKILQALVPNSTKVDLVTMLEKAINYVKFLQLQVKVLTSDEYWPEHQVKKKEVHQWPGAVQAQ